MDQERSLIGVGSGVKVLVKAIDIIESLANPNVSRQGKEVMDEANLAV